MVMMAEPKALRRLGPMELYSSTRHHLGIYRGVAVSARYRISAAVSSASLDDVFTAALTTVVNDQPFLRVGILHEDDWRSSTFSHLESIDLRNHIDWRIAEAKSLTEYEDEVANMQAWLHDQRWPAIATRPPWKVIVVNSKGVFEQAHIDVIFGFHHAISDGTSGRQFHEHLLMALQTQAPNPNADTSLDLSFPTAPNLPEPQEEVIQFRNNFLFTVCTLWDVLGPSFLKAKKVFPWAARSICTSNVYKTRIIPLDFEESVLKSFLTAAREHETTLTGLFHALILTALARRLDGETAACFASSTPISLRPYISETADSELKGKMRTLVTSHLTNHDAAIVTALREGATDDLIWASAQRVKAGIAGRASEIPVNDGAGLLSMIPDYWNFWRSKEGKPRESTWEISNVGILNQDVEEDGWKITRGMFTNGAMVVGSAMGFNMVSVRGQGLTFGVSWQEGDIEEEIIVKTVADVKGSVMRWQKEGKFLA